MLAPKCYHQIEQQWKEYDHPGPSLSKPLREKQPAPPEGRSPSKPQPAPSLSKVGHSLAAITPLLTSLYRLSSHRHRAIISTDPSDWHHIPDDLQQEVQVLEKACAAPEIIDTAAAELVQMVADSFLSVLAFGFMIPICIM